ncbi:hypothetical protein [Halalkalicoccus sp. NIPERK01]|uniref:COG1470 family protein n=1 Tax=Halalkalicoccus sp. NIPERK01 TaxID=3053469 RepID=UPI00256EB572|nr:hypothetical protein [Halalkalicoccus sp. NIPERK01]MDL5362822.1 hypothetical protein [Halalkalicoccus sp. NIPERK01]
MIPDELDTLRAAAERDDRIAVMASTERLDAVLEQQRFEHRRFDTIAVLLDQLRDDSDGDDAKSEYRETISELEQRRIELERSTLAYVQGEDSSSTLIKSVDTVSEAYRESKEKIAALETDVSDAPIPPLLVVWGDPDIEIPKGAVGSMELTLSTIGRSHPDSIVIDTESDIPTKVTPSVLESLGKNETATIRVELSPSTGGDFTVFVTATGETNDRFRFTVRVLTKGNLIDQTTRLVGSFEIMLDSMEGRKRRNGLRNQVRTLQHRLESISDDLEDERQPIHSVNNRLDAARNLADAIEHTLTTCEPSVKRQELLYILENIKKEIRNAIEALP